MLATYVFRCPLPPRPSFFCFQEEWSSLITAVDEAHTSTTVPALPCAVTHFCLPFSPVCCMCYCASQRLQKLAEVAARENARLMPQGLEWIVTPNRHRSMGMVMALRWNADRPAFEAANPHRRPVSREPLPIEFMPPELRAQLAMAAMAPQVFAMQAQQAAAMGMAPPQSMGMSMGMGAPAAPLAPEHQFMEMPPYPPQQQSQFGQQQQFGDQQPQQQLQFGQQQSGLIYANPSPPSAYDEQTYAPPAYSGGPPQPAVQAGASGVLHVRAAATVAAAPVAPAPHSDSAAEGAFPDPGSGEGLQSPLCAAAACTGLAPCPRCGVVAQEAGARICARCGSPVGAPVKS